MQKESFKPEDVVVAKGSLRRWVRDQRLEAIMNEHGYPWEIQEHSLSELDWKPLFKARVGGLDERTVAEYAAAMDRGDPFPMTLFCPNSIPGAKASLLGGNHRSGGLYRAAGDKEPFPHYYVIADPMDLAALAVETNRIGGRRVGEDEAVVLAKEYRERYQCTIEDVAKKFRISYDVLRKALRIQIVQEAVVSAGGTVNGLGKSKLHSIGTLAFDEPLMVAAAKVIAETRCDSKAADDLCRRLRVETKPENRKEVLHDFGRQRRPERGNRMDLAEKPLRWKFLTAFRRAISILKMGPGGRTPKSLDQVQVTDPAEVAEVAAGYRRLRSALDVMLRNGGEG